MNVPNRLTVSRFVLTAIFLIVVFSEVAYGESISLLIFGVASLTDYFDGMIARRDNLITDFGKLMDPLADKILTCSAFIAFVGLGKVSAWMVVIIVARELAITGLRLLAASKNVVLAAERYGKHKTVTQIAAIIAILISLSFEQWGSFGGFVFGYEIAGRVWIDWLAEITIWGAVLLTFYSGAVYLWKNRELYLDDM